MFESARTKEMLQTKQQMRNEAKTETEEKKKNTAQILIHERKQ